MKETDDIEIDIKELLLTLKKKFLIILLATVIFSGMAGAATELLITPIYSSESTLYVLPQSTSISSLADIEVGTSLTQDYIVLVNTRLVMNQVIENLNLDYTYEEMLDKITVTNKPDTRMLELKVEDPNPQLAQQMVNELAAVTVKQIAEKMAAEEPNIISEGNLAASPDSPSLMRNAALGALLGLLLSVGTVIAVFILNDTVCTSEELEQDFGITVLASVFKDVGMKKQAKYYQEPMEELNEESDIKGHRIGY